MEYQSKEAWELLTGVADYFEMMFDYLARMFSKFNESMKKFPKEDAITSLKAMSRLRSLYSVLMLSFPCFVIPPEKKSKREKVKEERLSRHGALTYYHWEAAKELPHAILLAFSGLYATSNALLRICVESLMWGIIYDALAKYEYRARVTKSFREMKVEKPNGKWKTMGEFLDFLGKNDVGSAELLDMLEGYERKPNIRDCMYQLKEWSLLEESELNQLKNTYYGNLSKFVHRSMPDYTDVGIRVIHDIYYGWVEFEVVPPMFLEFQGNAERALQPLILALTRYMSKIIKENNYRLNKGVLNHLSNSANALGWNKLIDLLSSIESFFE